MQIRRLEIKPDIRDVAAEAGVSPSTVSSVMNGLSVVRRISPATARRVLDTAHEIGYYGGDQAARSTRMESSDGVTLKGVAAIAGVSIATVSFVLAGKAEERKFSLATITRIEQAAKEVDYKPNLRARELRRGLLVYTTRNP